MSETVLVTGGAGYVGSHACKALAEAGHFPIVFDDLSRGHREAVRWGPFEQGDIRDAERLTEVVRAFKPSAVFHFAALTYVDESVLHPARYHAVNVEGTQALLSVMQAENVRRLVFSSSCAVYGKPDQVPIGEETALRPISPYGENKAAAETALAEAAAWGLTSIALRYFNAAGADPAGATGEKHEPETHLIPIVLAVAAGRLPQLSINGTDYPTPDGSAVRDYIHVSDLAEAHILALGALGEEPGRRSLNLGTGRGYSVRQVIAATEQVTGCKVAAINAPRRPGDPPQLVADSALGQRTLGWSARLSDIDSIIATAWEWHQKSGWPAQFGGHPSESRLPA